MGEAKRRRQLDPLSYGKPKLIDELQEVFDCFIQKESDLIIASSAFVSENLSEKYTSIYQQDQLNGTKHQLVFPISSSENVARQVFVENQEQVMDSMMPFIQEHGKGWIAQLYDDRLDTTDFMYIPATRENLVKIETQVFTRSLGKMVGNIIKCSLEYWTFQEDSILIPVIAMSNADYPSSLFCI
ncbi:hypothetical protein [Nostoc sp. CCY 9925]|uniref:hypothetical protein n=1 Tax=Nostoc sp. CCY 9925 TaxID=3103865 RepID=UPI0039C6AFD4